MSTRSPPWTWLLKQIRARVCAWVIQRSKTPVPQPPPVQPKTSDWPEEDTMLFTAPLFKQSIRNLKTTIKGRAQTSRMMRQEANKLSGMAKHEVHLRMRRYGAVTRDYLLAYALIRGLAYKDAERSYHPGNEPDPHDILQALICGTGLDEDTVDTLWDTRTIKSWLEAPTQEMRAAA